MFFGLQISAHIGRIVNIAALRTHAPGDITSTIKIRPYLRSTIRSSAPAGMTHDPGLEMVSKDVRHDVLSATNLGAYW